MFNEEHKAFILAHYKNQSARQIAHHLNVSRREVSGFIDNLKKNPLPQAPSQLSRDIVPCLIVILLIVHLALRFDTFWLSHFPGDQNQYVGLAMKLQETGFKGYNLRRIDVWPEDEMGEILYFRLSPDEEGTLIKGLKQSGAGYYDIPFYHKGPAFPIALMISHQIFARGQDYRLVQNHLGRDVRRLKPEKYFSAQFYATIVPLFFSTLMMLLTFYLGVKLFSVRAGFYAAFLLAVNPVGILNSYKVWADDMLAAFVLVSVVLYLFGREKNKLWMSFLGGICCGIAVLTKQNAGVVFGGIIAYAILVRGSWRHIFSYGAGLFLLSAPWFLKIYQLYGDLLYSPVNPDIRQTDKTGWFALIASRPPAYILFSVGIPYLSPPLSLTYVTLKDFLLRLRFWNPTERLNEKGGYVALMWLWILSFIGVAIIYGGGDEHRRMLPAYPPIAILSAWMLDHGRIILGRVFENKLFCDAFIIAILIASAFWSVPMGISTVMDNGALILKPF